MLPLQFLITQWMERQASGPQMTFIEKIPLKASLLKRFILFKDQIKISAEIAADIKKLSFFSSPKWPPGKKLPPLISCWWGKKTFIDACIILAAADDKVKIRFL